MLMPEVATLGQAAHVEVIASCRIPEMSALAANDGRRLPVGLDTPAMKNGVTFAFHPWSVLLSVIHRPGLMFDKRTPIRIADLIKSYYASPVNPTVKPFPA